MACGRIVQEGIVHETAGVRTGGCGENVRARRTREDGGRRVQDFVRRADPRRARLATALPAYPCARRSSKASSSSMRDPTPVLR